MVGGWREGGFNQNEITKVKWKGFLPTCSCFFWKDESFSGVISRHKAEFSFDFITTGHV